MGRVPTGAAAARTDQFTHHVSRHRCGICLVVIFGGRPEDYGRRAPKVDGNEGEKDATRSLTPDDPITHPQRFELAGSTCNTAVCAKSQCISIVKIAPSCLLPCRGEIQRQFSAVEALNTSFCTVSIMLYFHTQGLPRSVNALKL